MINSAIYVRLRIGFSNFFHNSESKPGCQAHFVSLNISMRALQAADVHPHKSSCLMLTCGRF